MSAVDVFTTFGCARALTTKAHTLGGDCESYAEFALANSYFWLSVDVANSHLFAMIPKSTIMYRMLKVDGTRPK
jgi:hypothetical protein